MVKHTQAIYRQIADELFECVWPLCEIGATRVEYIPAFELAWRKNWIIFCVALKLLDYYLWYSWKKYKIGNYMKFTNRNTIGSVGYVYSYRRRPQIDVVERHVGICIVIKRFVWYITAIFFLSLKESTFYTKKAFKVK